MAHERATKVTGKIVMTTQHQNILAKDEVTCSITTTPRSCSDHHNPINYTTKKKNKRNNNEMNNNRDSTGTSNLSSKKETTTNNNNTITTTKTTSQEIITPSNNKRDWNEIEMLFQEGKEMKKKTQQEDMIQRQKEERKRIKRIKRQQEEQERQPNHNTAKKHDHSNDDVWVDDGLGGKYNAEGYTGRIADGVKIFKAHLLSKPGAGTTPLCPFDCDCCFI